MDTPDEPDYLRELIIYAADNGWGVTFSVNEHNQWAIGYMRGMGGGDLVADSDLTIAAMLALPALQRVMNERDPV